MTTPQEPKINDARLIEELASLEHDQWRSWARHLLFHADGEPNISERRKKRWEELINTEYEDLNEEWKEFDRQWALKSYALILHERKRTEEIVEVLIKRIKELEDEREVAANR